MTEKHVWKFRTSGVSQIVLLSPGPCYKTQGESKGRQQWNTFDSRHPPFLFQQWCWVCTFVCVCVCVCVKEIITIDKGQLSLVLDWRNVYWICQWFFLQVSCFLTPFCFFCGSPRKILVLFAVCIMPSYYLVVCDLIIQQPSASLGTKQGYNM